MLWALQLTKSHHFQSCIIEGDAKICISACIGKLDDCWTLSAICYDVKCLLHSFTSVGVQCIRREVNSATHALAKFAFQSQVSTFCNIYALPPSVYEAWLKEVISCD